jgi:hypothetical protein
MAEDMTATPFSFLAMPRATARAKISARLPKMALPALLSISMKLYRGLPRWRMPSR